ncbi:GNAT family N-acetyltransferase [Microbacterium aurantiacum]|nr:GNAT family N-acetyltransferase [Microbacterium chocolatum]
MASVKNFHHPGDLDPYPATNALNRLHPHSRRAAKGMGQALEIRTAEVDDARGIAVVHVTSWQTAYRGLLPDDMLDELSVEQREGRSRAMLADPHPAGRTIVADRDGEIVGWASFGAGRDEGAGEQGELWALYARPDLYSTGVGHALIAAVETALCEEGFASAYLWVLDGNDRAATFYERRGWTEDGTVKLDERQNTTLLERRRTKSLG